MAQEEKDTSTQENSTVDEKTASPDAHSESAATPEEQADDNLVQEQPGNENRSSEKSGSETDRLKAELAEQKEKFLRLYAEFDNYRRRTAKEKLEFMKTANEGLMKELISVLDDFDRARKSFDQENKEARPILEGFDILHKKLVKVLQQKGLTEMEDVIGKPFDTDFHEAITQIPAPSEDMKGKIVDVVEKGYIIDEKVIRYAKVVIGS